MLGFRGTILTVKKCPSQFNSFAQYHKLNDEIAVLNVKDDAVRERAVVDNIVVSTVAAKGVMG